MRGGQCRASYRAMRGQYSLTNSHSYHLRGLLITLLWILHQVQAENIECCTNVSGSCKSACEEISLVAIATDPEEYRIRLHDLNKFCDKHMETFWNCMNKTLEDINEGSNWIGRPCCSLPQSGKCKRKCLQAESSQNLTASCRKSDEIVFYTCIERQEIGERCCRNASTSKCLQACKNAFVGNFTPNKELRDAINKYCSDKNPGIQQCVQSYFPVTPADPEVTARNMHCCDYSTIEECKTECKKILGTEKIESDEIFNSLHRKGCGPVLPHKPMWACFLKNSVVNEPGGSVVQSAKVGIDSGKLQCCFRAATANCKRLCEEAFTNQWNSFGNFHRICQYQLAESKMVRCLTEVDEPCELGCEGLNYCSNFNFRPTQLFRNCAPFADHAAQKDIDSWEEKRVIHLPMMEIPILKISQCHSNVWKAIACALQIKPCHHEAHVNRICKSDCIDILNKCVDRSSLLENQNPITMCELLSPTEKDTPCISLAPYLDVSKDIATAKEVTHPCKPNECNHSQICTVERNCLIGQPCQQYTCITGCRMGHVSNLIVPQNSFVRVPSNTQSRCHMVCYCNHDNDLEDCMTQPCFTSDDCWHEETKYDHNTFFKSGCKTCFCYDGEVTCSPKQCWSGLPCNCQDHYVPVCGANGKTYPSSCLARCAGLTDDQYEFGACYDSDPCSPNSCHPYYRCVPKKRVCLSIRHRSCKQYDCVNMQHNCNQLPKSPVCDTDNVEQPNICWMLQRQKSLAYYGKCMPHCRARGLVCGHNGETYASECAAWAERVFVDYKGNCAAVGFNYGKSSRCGGIKCAPLPSEHCTKVYPPGSCCPICGAALRLLYSQKLSDWSVEAIRDVDTVVIQTIAEKLRTHVKVTECDVFAYLSLESDIIVLVIAITDNPTKLQVEACVREAEKLNALIQQQSPTLLTELPLSFFTTAIMIDGVSDGAVHLSFNLFTLIITIMGFLLQRTMSN